MDGTGSASARWLVTALVGTLLFAAVCVYGAYCLLFWQGQWQLVFQPSSSVTKTPAVAYQEVSFDATESGVLQLRGWWVPGSSASTVLLMHAEVGSVSSTVPLVSTLHGLGFNVFVFDYRGFGKSVPMHPSEASTTADADAAWRYVTETRKVRGENVVLAGVGLGAAVAVEMARRHPAARGLVMVDAKPPLLETLHTRWLPVRWLFHDRFDPTATLGRLTMPKLFVGGERYYDEAAPPKEKGSVKAIGEFLRPR